MAEFFLVNITDGKYSYGKLFLKNHTVEESEKTILEYTKVLLRKADGLDFDCVFTHYFVKELKISQFYRINVIRKWADGFHELAIVLQPTNYDLIDYEWNDRIFVMVREKMRTRTCSVLVIYTWRSIFCLGRLLSKLCRYRR
ncbi:hypothetical protein NQ318_001927 [Aromia moschata]|uniref:Uncharacterized protein n=1 Tax=Aromia moschata TaxID=1265417 RepID=A0AAV8Z2Z8_9CUCU|nr:hypothetical protein NQ318_001927 [Aromia moschata]